VLVARTCGCAGVELAARSRDGAARADIVTASTSASGTAIISTPVLVLRLDRINAFGPSCSRTWRKASRALTA
jgi:hypothetical protein